MEKTNQVNTYEKAFEAFNSFKVLIVGDVMLDAYVWGKVARISPEAPVPVLACNRRENRLGGAANVAKNIKALGAKATICTVIGEDFQGSELLRLFEKNNLETSCIIKTKERRTTVKTRFLSGFHHLLRVDEEDTDFLSETLEKTLRSVISLFIRRLHFLNPILKSLLKEQALALQKKMRKNLQSMHSVLEKSKGLRICF